MEKEFRVGSGEWGVGSGEWGAKNASLIWEVE
jgi:hypothetical protein